MSFHSIWQQQDWDALALAIHSKTDADVQRALARPNRDWQDVLAPASAVGERQLLHLIAALRLFAPEVDLSLSTRESAQFRDNVFPLGITTASAASSTRPGGYAEPSDDLEQFSIDDGRSPQAVAAALADRGLQPVWKDWHPAYSGAALRR